jgi:hypothetical protein
MTTIWCGKASAKECIDMLVLTVRNLTDFPQYSNLLKLQEFMTLDKSHRFEHQMKTLEAPIGTEKTPIDKVNMSVLVKLLVHRIDTVCIEYFHTVQTVEWKPRNMYGEQLIQFWKSFNKSFIGDVDVYHANQKSPVDQHLESIKSLLPKVKGVWGERLVQKLSQVEKAVEKQLDEQLQEQLNEQLQEQLNEQLKNQLEEQLNKEPGVTIARKVVVKTPKTKEPVDDGGEWISVGKKKKSAQHKK